jgi:hypothetical protein
MIFLEFQIPNLKLKIVPRPSSTKVRIVHAGPVTESRTYPINPGDAVVPLSSSGGEGWGEEAFGLILAAFWN